MESIPEPGSEFPYAYKNWLHLGGQLDY